MKQVTKITSFGVKFLEAQGVDKAIITAWRKACKTELKECLTSKSAAAARPQSDYQKFCAEHRAELKKENLTPCDIMKRLGEMWQLHKAQTAAAKIECVNEEPVVGVPVASDVPAKAPQKRVAKAKPVDEPETVIVPAKAPQKRVAKAKLVDELETAIVVETVIVPAKTPQKRVAKAKLVDELETAIVVETPVAAAKTPQKRVAKAKPVEPEPIAQVKHENKHSSSTEWEDLPVAKPKVPRVRSHKPVIKPVIESDSD